MKIVTKIIVKSLILLCVLLQSCANESIRFELDTPRQVDFGIDNYNIEKEDIFLLVILIGAVENNTAHFKYKVVSENDEVIWKGQTSDREKYIYLPRTGIYTFEYGSDLVATKEMKILVNSDNNLYFANIDLIND